MNEINKKKPLFLGAHLSISGGLHKALETAGEYGCSALQIFTKNANNWKEKTLAGNEIERFNQARIKTGIKEIASHTSYLINLAGCDKEKFDKSMVALENELKRASDLNIPYVVMHPGSHMNKGVEKGMSQISKSINIVFENTPNIKTRLLLETTAGQGSSIGHTFEQLASILKKIKNKKRIGVCLDTCHIFAAGYDIRDENAYDKTMALFDAAIGYENLFFIHLNDSKKDLGSRVDRHEHIGEGKIGLPGFACIMNDKNLSGIPKIIETPGEKNGQKWNSENLNTLIKSVS